MPEDLIQDLIAEASIHWQFKALVSLVLILAAVLLRWLALRIVKKRIDDPTVNLIWRQIVNVTVWLFLALILMRIWLEGAGSVLALLTLVAAAMTIVHKELIQNLTAWSIIAWRGLFELGDHIEIGGHTGKVTDLGPMYFTIDEATGIDTGLRPTGRTIRIPNAIIITKPVINYSEQDLRWSDVVFAVNVDSDWEGALQIIEDVVNAESAAIHTDQAKPTDRTITVRVKDGKVFFAVHFPTKPGDRLLSQTRVTRQVLMRFADANLNLV